MKLESRPDEELSKIAVDFYKGLIFSDRHIRESADNVGHTLSMIFMPMALGAFKDWTAEDFGEIGMMYEYLDKAGPRSINGYPSFFSFKLLNKPDSVKVFERYNKLREAEDALLKGEPNVEVR